MDTERRSDAPPYHGESAHALWHVSDHDGIPSFEPRVSATSIRPEGAAGLGDRHEAPAALLVPTRLSPGHLLGGLHHHDRGRRCVPVGAARTARPGDRDDLARARPRRSRPRISDAGGDLRAGPARRRLLDESRRGEVAGVRGDRRSPASTRRGGHRAAHRPDDLAAVGSRHGIDSRIQRHPPAERRTSLESATSPDESAHATSGPTRRRVPSSADGPTLRARARDVRAAQAARAA